MPVRRYPVLPIVATILKAVAALIFVMFIALAIWQFGDAVHSWKGGVPQPPYGQESAPIKDFGQRLITLIQPFIFLLTSLGLPALLWTIADGALAMRDVEFNTRPTEVVAATNPKDENAE